EDGEVFLIDFGAANEYVGVATGTLVGKQAYIAPEQFRGKAAPQSDIYALGGTMHFLLTGEDPQALSSSHPRAINKNVSDAIDELVAEATRLELADRIASAHELSDRISALLPGTVLSFSSPGKRDK